MAYEVNFAGINLSDYCTVLNIERSVLPPRQNFSKSIPTMNGSFYTGYHYGERTISLEVYIKAATKEEYTTKVRELANAIHTENPCKLYISDEPGKYYYAVIDGSTDLEKTVFSGTLMLNFICHDPIAYSDEWKSFIPDSKNIVTISNNGTANTKMNVSAEFSQPSCFFQMTNHKGETVLIGKPKSATETNKSMSPKVISDPCETLDGFTTLSDTLLDTGRNVTGTYTIGNNGTGVLCNYGSEESGKWTGAAFKRSLGKDLDEFEVSVKFIFSSRGTNYKPSGSTSTGYGTYEVTAQSGLNIRTSASVTSTRLAILPHKTKINVTAVNGKWYKHTTKVGTKTYTGYSHSDYLKKVSTSKTIESRATEYAEEELGLLEIYGFDKHGTKLFKGMFDDANAYYEYVKPRVYIGNSKVLADDSATPTPRKVTTKDSDGKTITSSAASGVYGNWNDLCGQLVIKRTKNSKGTYLWNIKLYKVENGKTVRTLATANSISSSSYPSGALNYLGFYIGRYGEYRPMDYITIQHIHVNDLSPRVTSEENQEIFDTGDILNIDYENGSVTLNQKDFLSYIDIGSEFFDTPSGSTQVAIKTDDSNIDVAVGIQERFM